MRGARILSDRITNMCQNSNSKMRDCVLGMKHDATRIDRSACIAARSIAGGLTITVDEETDIGFWLITSSFIDL